MPPIVARLIGPPRSMGACRAPRVYDGRGRRPARGPADMTDPNDETQPHDAPGVILPPPGPASAGEIPASAPPPLVANPDRPVSDWREPPWLPADRDRHRDRGPSLASIVFGLVVLAIGVWDFLHPTPGGAGPASGVRTACAVAVD